ncbi:MAG: NAD(P)H-binding protein [Ferruginibacter sp.]
MTITIFGATGTVGKQLVKQALQKDYKVRAFGRNVFSADFPPNDNLHLISGALFDNEQLLHAIEGADAVLSVLGGATDGTDKTRSLGMKHITGQMQKAGVERIVAVGGMGSLDAPDGEIFMNRPGYPAKFIAVGREHWHAYQYLVASGLQWTFVCPPDLIDAASTGVFRTASNTVPEPNNFKINTGDLAMFMLKEMIEKNYLKQRVGISN